MPRREVPTEPASEATSSFEVWGGPRRPHGNGGTAGLLLLYAEGFDALPRVFVLDRSTVLVGREAEAANLVIPQRAVSRVHAALQQSQDGTWCLRDLDSRNGVLVNGRRIREATLHGGDELRIGNAVFAFVASGAEAYAPYALDGRVAAPSRCCTIPGAIGGLAMARISVEVETIATSALTVLVHGETGTGKELVARALHGMSGRSGPLRSLNCASIPATLVESELFGHVRGAFSGATRDHVGMVRAAHGGTLFLDEIGDMPLEAQTKLLRVLETKEVVPVGAVTAQRVDVRVVSATHHDLRALVAAGRFRADLYARLDGYTLRLPPLRERKEDLYALVRHFLAADGAATREITFGFMVALCHYDWPYNVRELGAVVKRALTVSDGAALDAAHLSEPILARMRAYGDERPLPPPASTREEAAPSEPKRPREPRPPREELVRLLQQHDGNVTAVARAIDRDRGLLNRWLRADGIVPEDYRR